MTLTYEDQRAQNIADNEALLKSLGLDVPHKIGPPAPAKASPRATKVKGKKATRASTREKRRPDDAYHASGSLSSESDSDYAPAPRRVGRTRPQIRRLARDDDDREPARKAERLGVRTEDPKTFGAIPGVPVGTWWATRMACSTAAIHAPTVAGISGNPELGAWSVALSGGYPDDVDLGEAFTYTGSGGRDLKGTKQNPKNLRTAPQTFDQSFENSFNASLKTSSVTKNPVRVIRGFKLDSVYAPREGYRYDGLYVVERAWMAPGLTDGLKVCKYAFKRLPGQPPLPRNDAPEDEEEDSEDDDKVSEAVKLDEDEGANGHKLEADPGESNDEKVKIDSEDEADLDELDAEPDTKRRKLRRTRAQPATATPLARTPPKRRTRRSLA